MPHDTPHDSPSEAPSVSIANQIINIANKAREDGAEVDDIAAGLRHAAANFSAFAYFQAENKTIEPDDMVQEMINMLSHYLELHKPKEQPASGLDQLINQAKNEI